MMDSIHDILKFYEENGYFIATTTNQHELAKRVPWLRTADPAWFPHEADYIYVHESVKHKRELPCALYWKAYPAPDFFKNEIAYLTVRIRDDEMPGPVLVRINRKIDTDKYEVQSIGGGMFIARKSDLRRTFDITE